MATCYRHPDRTTGVSCSRCDRPICSDCMTPTPVGMRCPECSGDRQQVKTIQSRGGSGALSSRVPEWAAEFPVTFIFMALNVIAFLGQLFTGAGGAGIDGIDYTSTFVQEGGLCGTTVGDGGPCAVFFDLGSNEWWRLATAGFLHAGIIHLGLNMFVLYLLGRLVEPGVGSARFAGIYLVSLFAGSLGALLLTDPRVMGVGASGAVYGVFGATILIARDRGLSDVVTQLGFWLGLNLLITFSVDGISVGAHLGGLIGGLLTALVVLQYERQGHRTIARPEIAAMVVFAIVCIAVSIAFAGNAPIADL